MQTIEAAERVEDKSEFDLDWDDKHVVPPVVYPDLAFLFSQLEEITIRKVDARDGEDILDVGCGRATDAMHLAERSGKCFGIEPSENMIMHDFFDKVVCKGALDHFASPAKAVEEMARVVKPEGKVIITVANLDSFSCRLGRTVFVRIRKLLRREESIYEKMWETPFDHTYRFDYDSLRRLVEPHLEVEECHGVSLLFGFPWWGLVLNKMPQRISSAMLKVLDRLARRLPSLSDAIIIRCRARS
jgi:SAM-dependent methyltransferase